MKKYVNPEIEIAVLAKKDVLVVSDLNSSVDGQIIDTNDRYN